MFPKPKNLISSPSFIRFNKARQGDLFISQNVLYFWRTVARVAVSSAQSGTLFRPTFYPYVGYGLAYPARVRAPIMGHLFALRYTACELIKSLCTFH